MNSLSLFVIFCALYSRNAAVPLPQHQPISACVQDRSLFGEMFHISPLPTENNEMSSNNATSDVEFVEEENCPSYSQQLSNHGCKVEVELDFDQHRIPQTLLQARCVVADDNIHGTNRRLQRQYTLCEEVRYDIPVLKKSCDSGAYQTMLENISVACIRTVPVPRISSKPGHNISIKGPS